jgi:hypothetical protein
MAPQDPDDKVPANGEELREEFRTAQRRAQPWRRVAVSRDPDFPGPLREDESPQKVETRPVVRRPEPNS